MAVTLFLAGLFITGALLPGLSAVGTRTTMQRQELRRILGLARYGTTPALLGVWGFGIAMAVRAGWFASGWLQAKLGLVLALSAWHGWQMRCLRRLADDRPVPRPRYRALGLAALAVGGIVALVTLKPF